MPFDGTFLFKLKTELQQLSGARADKIHQPSNDELVLFLRGKQGTTRLIINLSARPRLYLCNHSPENPAVPPRFCTVLRKYLSGARLTEVRTVGFERICFLDFDTFNEMGDEVRYTLVLELISAGANAILINSQNKIIDALRRSDLETQERIVHSGASYIMPPAQNKLDIMSVSEREIAAAAVETDQELWQAILDTLAGASPLVAREIARKVDEDATKRCAEIENCEERLASAIAEFKSALLSPPIPTVVLKDKSPFDFSWTNISTFSPEQTRKFESLSEACEFFFSEKQRIEQAAAKTGELSKYLTTLRARIARKALARKRDLEKCEGAELARIKGELIKANLYAIPKGSAIAELQNYYSPDLEVMRVKLDPSISPADNAARYFKEYKKLMAAKGMLGRLIEECEIELDYIDSVHDALSRAETSAELEQIKQELSEVGYLRRQEAKKSKKAAVQPKKFKSEGGFEILVGRNNTENDKITFTDAEKNDIWLHTKEIHGSHVVIKCRGGDVDDQTLLYAAKLAAAHSKAKDSSSVPVDYTLARYVKKPSGARPGAVIYTNQKTVYVTPERE